MAKHTSDQQLSKREAEAAEFIARQDEPGQGYGAIAVAAGFIMQAQEQTRLELEALEGQAVVDARSKTCAQCRASWVPHQNGAGALTVMGREPEQNDIARAQDLLIEAYHLQPVENGKHVGPKSAAAREAYLSLCVSTGPEEQANAEWLQSAGRMISELRDFERAIHTLERLARRHDRNFGLSAEESARPLAKVARLRELVTELGEELREYSEPQRGGRPAHSWTAVESMLREAFGARDVALLDLDSSLSDKVGERFATLEKRLSFKAKTAEERKLEQQVKKAAERVRKRNGRRLEESRAAAQDRWDTDKGLSEADRLDLARCIAERLEQKKRSAK